MIPPITMIPLKKKITWVYDTSFQLKRLGNVTVEDLINHKFVKDVYCVMLTGKAVLKSSLLLQVISKKEHLSDVSLSNSKKDKPIHILVHFKLANVSKFSDGSSTAFIVFKDDENRMIKVTFNFDIHPQAHILETLHAGDCLVMEWAYTPNILSPRIIRFIANTTTNTIFKIPSWCE